jgi:hypothetical protein
MDWSCSLMQAGRPYKDRLFPLGQFNRAIAGFSYSRQPYRAQALRPYGWTTNGAIACSLLVN